MFSNFSQHVIIKHNNCLQKLSQPLRDHLDLAYFSYQQIDFQGNYRVLADRADWAEYYFNKACYLESPFHRHPSFFQSGACLCSAHHEAAVHLPYLEKFAIGDIFVLIERTSAGVEFFGFSGKFDDPLFGSRAMNTRPLLLEYCRYFKEETFALLAEEEPVDLMALRGESFFAGHPLELSPQVSERLAMLQSFRSERGYQHVQKLSKREHDCVKFSGQGLGITATARQLGLSPRTVEHYLENCKNKLECDTREEIVDLGRTLLDIGYYTLP